MMSVFKQFKKLLPSLNRRRITWRMIARACQNIGALIFNVPLRLDGYFVPAELSESGKPEIYVNARLSEDLQIATAVHELKHAVFDNATNEILFSFRNEWTTAARREFEEHRRYEFEACAMASIALLPVKKLRYASLGLFEIDDDFITNVWSIRLHLRSEFGI